MRVILQIPEFETKILFLRGVKLEDADSYEKNFVDYEVIQHLFHKVPWPYPKGGVKEFLTKEVLPNQGLTRWFWVIFLKENRNEVIGSIELLKNAQPGNRGFWLARQYWGKGFMTEAIDPVTDYAFEHIKFEKLIFANAVGNYQSRRIKEKTGAVYIGERSEKFVNPAYDRCELWELTKENWKKNKKNKHDDKTYKISGRG